MRRLVLELSAAALSGALAVVTMVTHDWIEVVFRVDPDHGSGLAEVVVIVALLAVCVGSSIRAGARLRRLRLAATA